MIVRNLSILALLLCAPFALMANNSQVNSDADSVMATDDFQQDFSANLDNSDDLNLDEANSDNWWGRWGRGWGRGYWGRGYWGRGYWGRGYGYGYGWPYYGYGYGYGYPYYGYYGWY
jgi:hypothetical protein